MGNRMGSYWMLAVAGMLLIGGCGKDQTLDKQEAQRNQVGPELLGVWVSKCEGNSIRKLNFDGERLTLERTNYFDSECSDKHRTLRQSGNFKLVSDQVRSRCHCRQHRLLKLGVCQSERHGRVQTDRNQHRSDYYLQHYFH